MYKSFKRLTLNGAHSFGILRGLNYLDGSRNALYALVYHRVDWEDSQPRLDPQNLSATPRQFEQQMRLLVNEYHPVTGDEVLEAVTGGKPLSPRAVLVTVDDGYRDFKEHIQPIAGHYGIKPILFVPTAYAGTGIFWWDQLYDALRRTKLAIVETPLGILSLSDLVERQTAFLKLAEYMKTTPYESALAVLNDLCHELVPDPFSSEKLTLDWDELRELARLGITIAPHTHTHPALGNISLEQTRFEILESKRLIRSEIGSNSDFFAYPYGSSAAIGDTGKIVREFGFQLAFTMIQRRARLDKDDPMHMPRIGISPRLTFAQLHAHLSTIYNL
ncbi:MAG: polysaccharide deacetylase family protein [Chloroflexi bacterium]|nr:polysaccharide deacetylase family protein [Chloroflexota bacterium]